MDDPVVPPIASFRDAVGFAMELTDRYAFVNAAVLLAGDGRPVDLAVVEGIAGSIEPVVAWAAGVDHWATPARSSLLISVRPVSPDIVCEADIGRYRRARWSLAGAGCRLLDWVETDGDLIRSYAYLTDPARAWADDPPGDRLADGGPT
jgi:hypothetical protein